MVEQRRHPRVLVNVYVRKDTLDADAKQQVSQRIIHNGVGGESHGQPCFSPNILHPGLQIWPDNARSGITVTNFVLSFKTNSNGV